MFHKDSTPLKEKILVAKKILTPIIQDLMTDALVQTEIDKLSKIGRDKRIEGKNINILFNNIKPDDTKQSDETQSENEWVTKILREISRDLDEPFEKVHLRKRTMEEATMGETLLEKLISVYKHLGEIIEDLRYLCGIQSDGVSIQKSINTDVRLTMAELPLKLESTTENDGNLDNNNAELNISNSNCEPLISKIYYEKADREVVNYQCGYKDVYVLAPPPGNSEYKNFRRNICSSNSIMSLRHSGKNDKCVTTRENKSAATLFSEHNIQEHSRNQFGNKEIVIKCLEGLDQVRKYLETLRNDEEGDESPFSGMDNHKHDKCIEIQSDSLCKFLQKQENSENNLEIGESSLLKDSSYIYNLPDRNERGTATQQTGGQNNNVSSRQRYSIKESRIPKLIHKKRANVINKNKCEGLKIILKNREDSHQNMTNLVIFNPEDPSKSIIKMKDQENSAAASPTVGVSKIMKPSEKKLKIIFLYQRINAGEKETMRNPFWSGSLKFEPKINQNVRGCCFYLDRFMVAHVLLLPVYISNVLKIDEIGTVLIEIYSIIIILKDLSIPFFFCRVSRAQGIEQSILMVYLNYENYCTNNGLQKQLFENMDVPICFHWFFGTNDSDNDLLATKTIRRFQKPMNGTVLESFRYTPSLLNRTSEKYVLEYMDNLFRFMSSLKGNFIPNMHQCDTRNKIKEEYSFEYNKHNNQKRQINGTFQINQKYQTYFFSCTLEREEELDSPFPNSDQWDNLSTYPIWRIKKSKYYNLPRKKFGNTFIGKDTEEQGAKKSEFSIKYDSQESETKLCADKSLEQKMSEDDNISRKPELKRKVSFRDEVDFSKSGDYHKERSEYLDNVNGKKEHLSHDLSNDELSDGITTDSLMILDSLIPKHTKQQINSRKNNESIDPALTNSAEYIAAKLSQSFEDKNEGRFTSIATEPLLKFKDETKNSLSEVSSSREDTITIDNVNSFTSTLLNSVDSLDMNSHNKEKQHIKSVRRRCEGDIDQIGLIKNEMKNLARTEKTLYYDYKGNPIRDLFDECGCKIELVGKDLPSKIFDAFGNIQKNLYTKKGKRINGIYNAHGVIYKKPAINFCDSKWSNKHPMVADRNAPNSLSQLFEDDSTEKQNKVVFSEKKHPDLEHCYSGKELNHEVQCTTRITSKESERLNNYHHTTYKQCEQKFDSEEHEKITISKEDGARKCDVSISWLNELLSTSKAFAKRRKKAIFRRKFKPRRAEFSNNELLYDIDGNVITSVYDFQGKLLAKSTSGNLKLLIPFLFSNSGSFVEGRYLSENNELKHVFDKDKNIIECISSTTVNEILAKSDEDGHEGSSFGNEKAEFNLEKKNDEVTVQEDLTESKFAVPYENARKSLLNIVKLSTKQDENQGIMTLMHESKEKQLEISNLDNPTSPLPYSPDSEERASNRYYDKKGQKLGSLHDDHSDISKNTIDSLTKLKSQECVNKSFDHNDTYNDKQTSQEISLDEGSDLEKINSNEMNAESELKQKSKKLQNHHKLKYERNKPDKFKSSSKKSNSSEERVSSFNSIKYNNCRDEQLSSSEVDRNSLKHNVITHRGLSTKTGMSLHKFQEKNRTHIKEEYDPNRSAIKKFSSGVVKKIASFLFDKNGMLSKTSFDKFSRKITRIYDNTGRNIRKTSVNTIASETTIEEVDENEGKYKKYIIYDRHGQLVNEIYDRKRHQRIINESLSMGELSRLIFHRNGDRKRVYNKNGEEIGPLYDYQGNILEYSPSVKQRKEKVQIFSQSGCLLKNFYDFEGNKIEALYNHDGWIVCSAEKKKNNVNVLSKFLFDEKGFFLSGKYFDFYGSRMRKLFDSNGDIIHSIIKTRSQKSSQIDPSHHVRDVRNTERNTYMSTISEEVANFPTQRRKLYSSRKKNKVNERMMNMTSLSDIELDFKGSKLRPLSAYFSNDAQTRNEFTKNTSGVISRGKFYDRDGKLLLGVYNSKSKLLGYSASGNAEVLCTYLFDRLGNFIPGRLNIDGKPLMQVYDSKGNWINVFRRTESTDVLNLKRKNSRDINRHSEPNIEEIHDCDIYHSNSGNHSNDGSLAQNFSRSENRHSHSIRDKSSSVGVFKTRRGSKRRQYEKQHRKSFPFFSHLRDKFLTVVFENMSSDAKFSSTSSRYTDLIQKKSDFFEESQSPRVYIRKGKPKHESHEVLKITENEITSTYKKNTRIRNDEDIGSLLRGSTITIYTNEKLVPKLHGGNRNPAKVDSDLIYLVSKQSLPGELDTPIEPVFTQMHYTSEGKLSSNVLCVYKTHTLIIASSRWKLAMIASELGNINNSQFNYRKPNFVVSPGTNCYDSNEFGMRGYSKKRTTECVCQQCQNTGSNKNFIEKLGGEFMTRLSKFTIPFDRFLIRNIFRKASFKEEKYGTDSLEVLINNAFAQNSQQRNGRPEQRSCSSSCISLQADDKLPISRKMVQDTLLSCVHLNSSSNVVGRVSNMMLQHFTTSILQEIKQTFYRKLDVLQCRTPNTEDSSIFESDTSKEDICIGTESKFEDSLIGKHDEIQTEEDQIYHNSRKRPTHSSEYLQEINHGCPCVRRRTFVCKLPGSEPFVFTMSIKNGSYALKNNKGNNEKDGF